MTDRDHFAVQISRLETAMGAAATPTSRAIIGVCITQAFEERSERRTATLLETRKVLDVLTRDAESYGHPVRAAVYREAAEAADQLYILATKVPA